MKIEISSYSSHDLVEYEKRYISDITFLDPLSGFNAELDQMTLQVQEVLPLVPYRVIYKDLSKYL